MKTKKFSKKLTLNKKTIADLNDGEMKAINGGYYTTIKPLECVTCTCSCGCTDTCNSLCDTTPQINCCNTT